MTIDRIIETASERGAVLAMQALGVTSGELSQRQARKVYGKYFSDAVASGRLTPCRVEDGRAGTKFTPSPTSSPCGSATRSRHNS